MMPLGFNHRYPHKAFSITQAGQDAGCVSIGILWLGTKAWGVFPPRKPHFSSGFFFFFFLCNTSIFCREEGLPNPSNQICPDLCFSEPFKPKRGTKMLLVGCCGCALSLRIFGLWTFPLRIFGLRDTSGWEGSRNNLLQNPSLFWEPKFGWLPQAVFSSLYTTTVEWKKKMKLGNEISSGNTHRYLLHDFKKFFKD